MGVDDEMSQIRRLRYFIEGQDCQLNENIIYQDNQSAVKLEKNGKASCEKRTRNINIRYFFVTGHIQARELSVKYCPILEIIGDYFVEPLQGSLFQRFRNLMLGIKEDDISSYNAKAVEAIKQKKAKSYPITTVS